MGTELYFRLGGREQGACRSADSRNKIYLYQAQHINRVLALKVRMEKDDTVSPNPEKHMENGASGALKNN